jgi:hypothetical protein
MRDEMFLETIELNIVFNNPVSFDEIVMAVISYELLQGNLLSTTV